MIEDSRDMRAKIREDLPPEAFRAEPLRTLWYIPFLGLVLIGSVLISVFSLPWYVNLVLSLLLGSCWGSMSFLGHEIGHGACVRSRRLQDFYMYVGLSVFCMSPQLWRIWHHQIHHPHANVEARDTDCFGLLENVSKRTPIERFFISIGPGSGNPVGFLSLFVFFTLYGQAMLWILSKRIPGFEHLPRKRVIADTFLYITFWILLCVFGGLKVTLFVVLIPMLLANFCVMSYIFTNHMLRPLVEVQDQLSTTMSVTTFKFIDLIHFNFSHHVEHHLFPGMSSRYYPLVRQSLLRHAKDRYLAPPHWWALYMLLSTPRVYADSQTLVEPNSGRKVAIADVETLIVEAMS